MEDAPFDRAAGDEMLHVSAQAAPLRVAGPGMQLRRAREAAGLGVAQVSARLRLDQRIVTALEADRYEGLPAPTFVRGYLVSYARLVDVPAEPVIDAFNAVGMATPKLVINPRDSAREPASPPAQESSIPWLTLATALVVVAGYALWEFGAWMPNPGEAATPSASASGEIARANGLEREPASADPVTSSTSVPLGDTAATNNVGAEPAGQPQSPPAPGAEQRAAIAAAGDTANVAANPDASIADLSAPVADPVIAGSPALPIPANAATGSDSQRIQPAAASNPTELAPTDVGPTDLALQFTYESWVEVHDADGQRLFWNLVAPGRELRVTGKAPLRVLLGNAVSVGVTMNGTSVNIVPLVDRGMARFILNPGDSTPQPWPG